MGLIVPASEVCCERQRELSSAWPVGRPAGERGWSAGTSPALCPEPASPSLQVEAIEYYTKLEQKLKEDYKREKEKVNEKPLGMAFVTFHNETITAM